MPFRLGNCFKFAYYSRLIQVFNTTLYDDLRPLEKLNIEKVKIPLQNYQILASAAWGMPHWMRIFLAWEPVKCPQRVRSLVLKTCV